MSKKSFIRVTKQFNFEMAHALAGHDGPCRHIHGHSYRLSVTVKGNPVDEQNSTKNGMVIDFKDLRKIIEESIVSKFDHALVLPENSATAKVDAKQDLFAKTIWVNFQPTCENLLLHFAESILEKLPVYVKLHRLKLKETPDSFAEWLAEDNLPADEK